MEIYLDASNRSNTSGSSSSDDSDASVNSAEMDEMYDQDCDIDAMEGQDNEPDNNDDL